MKQLVIDGNSKMGNKVGIFNLPPKKTCTPTKWCLFGKNGKPQCYALKNNFVWSNVVKALNWRLAQSKRKDFVKRLAKEINDKKLKYFRVHAAGDFYSKEYIEKWAEIARSCPDTIFRTTTRRLDLKDAIMSLNKLPNFIVRESLDNCRSTPSMGLPFAALSNLKVAKGKMKCKNDCDVCGHKCWKKRVSMCFDEH